MSLRDEDVGESVYL